MTRLVRFANNATSKLASNLSAIGLTISLTPGDGSKFPTLTAGQFFKATLIKSDGTKEVVKVTARSSDTMTIARANEAVGGVQTAYAFSAGDKVELRLTATALGDELDRLDAAAFLDVVGKSANYTITEADISKLIKTDTTAGNVTITLPQISTLTGSFEVQITKSTGDANTVTVTRSGSDTINGLNTHALGAQYQCVWLVADLTANVWTAITSANASNKISDQFVGSGTAGPFTLSGDPGAKNNTDVYVGGVYQNKSTYTVTGKQLTLGGVVTAGVIVECNWVQPLPIGTPSEGTVTESKLAPGVGFVSGTSMPFAQAAAPTGWTQVTDDTANNRMLRVVSTAGGGTAGTHSPILMDVVPAHTHGFTTGGVSSDHTHGDSGHIHQLLTNGGNGSVNSLNNLNNNSQGPGATFYTATGYANLGGATANHTHSGGTDGGSSQTKWQPRYINMIICVKN